MKLVSAWKLTVPYFKDYSCVLRWTIYTLSLSKSCSYLSLCLSLNSFCDETSRTWVSLCPQTRCVTSLKRPVKKDLGSNPKSCYMVSAAPWSLWSSSQLVCITKCTMEDWLIFQKVKWSLPSVPLVRSGSELDTDAAELRRLKISKKF